MHASPQKISILGVQVDPITVTELHDRISYGIKSKSHMIVANINVQASNIAYKNKWFRDFLSNAPITFCDGAGIILGAKILGYTIPERITFADWMWQFAEFAESAGIAMYFLGGRPGVAVKAANHLQAKFPNLKIAGTQHGYFNKMRDDAENQAVIAAINAVKPDVLIIGFGMPIQERWLLENWEIIDAKIALPGGAVFDYLSGELQRAPRFMTEHGLEWLGRLIIEPKRLWKRYILGNPLFLYRIFLQKFRLISFD